MVRVSAPGKVHLIGEHAVVYGEPAIIGAVGMRTVVEVERDEKINIKDEAMGFETEWKIEEAKEYARKAKKLWKIGAEKKDFSELFNLVKENEFKKAAIGFVLDSLGIDSGISVKISSDIPAGSGLGSSASLSVALAKAVAEVYGKNISQEEVNNMAYEIEKFKHGMPSGGDNSACCYGGLIWFRKGNPNEIKSLKEEIPYKLENFVLVYTKKPEKTTGELVSLVRGLKEDFRNKRISSLGKATEDMKKFLKEKNFEKVKELINLAQQNLSELGVSCKEIDEIAEKVVSIGGAAKLCGAGGGGIMLCYHKDKDKLVEAIKELGFEPWETELGVEGCRKED